MAIREEDIAIDSQGIASWDINIAAPIGGTYQGTFKFRTGLSPLQEIEADRDYRDLLGKNAEFAATHIENLAYSLAQLRQRVVAGPPFWFDGISKFPGSQVRDAEVLQEVFEAAVASEVKYRNTVKEKHKAAIQKLSRALEEKESEQAKAREQEMEELDRAKKLNKKATSDEL
jgi:hypothetical protein